MRSQRVRFVSLVLVFVPTLAVCGAEASDWPMLGRTITRNPVVPNGVAPTHWDIKTGKNIKWSARLGTQTYGTPVIAGGQVYVGTNNGAGYLKRYPSRFDLGCLVCFRESDGKFLWQFSAEKLPTGRVHDWPLQGIGCPPLVEGERLWFVSNRWEVLCLDTQGFRDSTNDGPYDGEPVKGPLEADVVWKFDLMGQLGVHPHPAGMGPDRRCSVAAYGDNIYVITGNGTDESRFQLPTPQAPSLVCLDKRTGKVQWTDNSPGANILQTQIASPLVAEIRGIPQVVVPQGDGWLRSFHAKSGKLIWEFDMNPKASRWTLGGRGTRNNILATPVLYENRIYIANGQEMEHGEGPGRLVCIDPAMTGDISSELAVDRNGKGIPHRRLQAIDPRRGEKAVANPNSGLIWEFMKQGENFEDQMHRAFSSVAVHDGLVIAADTSGLIQCLSAKTGESYWAYDVFATIWSAPLIVGDTVFVADEDTKVSIFRLSADPKRAMKPGPGQAYARGKAHDLVPLAELELDSAIPTSPVFANGTLYLATRSTLYAISASQADNSRIKKPEVDRESKHPSGSKSSPQPVKPNARVPRSSFVPTPRDVVDRMLTLAEVRKSDVVCDLGSGDGRIPIAAAKKYGAKAVGYEVDRNLVRLSHEYARTAGVADRVTFHQIDLFKADLAAFDVVTLYLYPAQNRHLLPRLKKLKAGVRIVTHRYELPGIRPGQIVSIESSESGETHTIYLYTTPLQPNNEFANRSGCQ